MKASYDKEVVRNLAAGRGAEILTKLYGVDPSFLTGQHGPCPKCGGTDRFRYDTEKEFCFCNQCFNKDNGDIFAAAMWFSGDPFSAVLARTAEYVGAQSTNGQVQNGHASNGQATAATKKKAHPDLRSAVGAAFRGLVSDRLEPETPVRTWTYTTDADGKPVMAVARFNLKAGDTRKTFRPFHVADGKWLVGDPPKRKLPLFNQPKLAAAETIQIHEGEGKCDVAESLGFIATTTAHGAKSVKKSDLAPLANKIVEIFPDNDDPGRKYAKEFAGILKKLGATVYFVILPDLPAGGDIVDFVELRRSQGKTDAEIRAEIDTLPRRRSLGKLVASEIDPAIEAKAYLATKEHDGVSRLRFYRGSFVLWRDGAYQPTDDNEVRGDLNRHLDTTYCDLCVGTTSNVLDQVKAHGALRSSTEPGTWITAPIDAAIYWKSNELLAAKNGIVHLPTLVAGQPNYLIPSTPRFFSQCAVDFDFDINAPPPTTWLALLAEYWPDDPAAISLLQEWCGLCLVADTSFQKILMLIGPSRSGKGLIGRVLRELVGRANVAGPTLAGLATNFGLQQLLGKLLAIISDARLSGRTDGPTVVERLLSISGEDALTVDRKHIAAVTCRFPTRLMILSNELPRLHDSSGAIAGRMIVLRMSKSFYGREDRTLDEKLLAERPGILLWAIAGWHRLHQRGRFDPPASGSELAEELRDLASPVGVFVRECCRLGPGFSVAREQLFETYKQWCQGNGRAHVEDDAGFGRALRAAVSDIGTSRPRIGGIQIRHYTGIDLKLQTGF